VTGLKVPALLRASHIKPWAACETEGERLDVFNGLLLAHHLDAPFDSGYIVVEDKRRVTVSDALACDARSLLGVGTHLSVPRIAEGSSQVPRVAPGERVHSEGGERDHLNR
jgi:putative restriction endonuclease